MVSSFLFLKLYKISNCLEWNNWFNIYGFEKEFELNFSLGFELVLFEYKKNLIYMYKLV